jgi:hypothetical protein
MLFSEHAKSRSRSRSIKDLSVMLVKRFGRSVKSSDNSEIWIANKRARRDILKLIKAVQQNFERADPLFAVVAADGTVITAGRRTRRIRHR